MSPIQRLLKSRKRIVIAIDSKGVHFRETLCVIHAWDSGEARYDTKPVGSLKHPKKFRKALAQALSQR